MAIQLPDTLELMIIIYACAYTGVIAVPIDSTRFSHELEHILGKVRPRGIIIMSSFDGVNYAGQFRDMFLDSNNRYPDLKHIILLNKFVNFPLETDSSETYTDMLTYEQLFDDDPSLLSYELPQTNPHDPLIILFTVNFCLRHYEFFEQLVIGNYINFR